jgi:3-deoxy-D-manno-octulosonic-acid transferase
MLYTIAVVALLPWAILHLWLRSRKQPEYLQHIGERFGHYPTRTHKAPLIWLHAVSVGETRAAEPLIVALRQRYPGHHILLTHMTPTGRATDSKILADCERRYLPYDTPWAVRRFLRHYQPALGLIMETELWPNLIRICRQQKMPLLLVNARLSERSAKRYSRFGELSKHALLNLQAIAAQTSADAARLQKLGAGNVSVFGNLKFDVQIPAGQVELAEQWRRSLGDRPIVLCASTREGEEALILKTWQHSKSPALLVIVPRHPQRFNEVANLAEQSGYQVAQRSQSLPAADTQVWIGDSMGEMAAYYGLADVTLMGGSLLDYGSQNLIEACALGTPVLLGPSTYNFAEAAANALACGAAVSIKDAEEFVATAKALLNDTARLATMRTAGLQFSEQHRGAAQRTLSLIETVLQ